MKSVVGQRMVAVLASLALHALIFLAMVFGLGFETEQIRKPVPLKIQATVITPQQVQQIRAQETETLREQAAERRREEQALAEQRRQRAEAERKAQEEARRKAAEEARAAQAQLDRERQIEAERQKQIEDLRSERERLAREREAQEKELERIAQQRRQEEEERARQLEEERLRQLMDIENQQLAAAERVTLEQEYVEAIRALVTQNWRRPPTAQRGLKCRVRVDQTPGGDVVSAQIINPCAADEVVQRSIVDAVYRAEPLPYRGFEDVFRRQIIFVFVYDG